MANLLQGKRGLIVGVALTVGWAFGFAASVAGLLGAVTFDFPAAPSILVTLTILLCVHGVLVTAWKHRHPASAAGRVAP